MPTPLRTTLGQLIVNEQLPHDLRDYGRVLDTSGLRALMRELAKRYPEKYREISHELLKIGAEEAYRTGGMSVGLEDLKRSPLVQAKVDNFNKQIETIQINPKLTDDQKKNETIKKTLNFQSELNDLVFEEAKKSHNPLAEQVISGIKRGGKANIATLIGADMMYVDQHDNPIPIPVTKSYSQGLSPAEFWAGTYGARKGLIDVKFSTQEAGSLAKQLSQTVHRQVITKLDRDHDLNYVSGLPASINDNDIEGSLLAHTAGPYKKNTVLTPKIIQSLKDTGVDKILVRSPIVGGPDDGGVYARDAGVRERGTLPPIGDQIGIAAAQALSEPLSQTALGSKHKGGVAGGHAVTGYKFVKLVTQIPKTFTGGAAHSKLSGNVERVEESPIGGQDVYIGGIKHFVAPGFDVNVKKGDFVEAGDPISNGIPNPHELVKYKHIGEGRRRFVELMKNAYNDMGINVHSRNIALLAKGLINHVRMVDEHNGYLPDDVVSYAAIENDYEPRKGHEVLPPKRSIGKYLEQPVLHYTIGTQVQPSMLKHLNDYNINQLVVHNDPPPFVPEMIRAEDNLQHDPDWMTRMLGQELKRSVLGAVQTGVKSDTMGTSYVPALSEGLEFGRQGKTKTWQPTH